jgi:hypothetical protein
MSYLHYLCLFAYSDVQHILCCFYFIFRRLVYPMSPVSLDCPFLIAPAVFPYDYLCMSEPGFQNVILCSII